MNKLFKKFMEYAIGNGMVMLISLVLVPVVSRYIGPEERGKVDLFLNYTSLIVLVFTMGMDQAFIRYYNNEDEDSRGNLLKRSIILPIIITLIGGIFFYIFRGTLGNLILVDKNAKIPNIVTNNEAKNLAILFTVNILINIIGNIGLINIRMKQKAKTYSLVSASNKLAYFFALFIFYKKFNGSYVTLLLTTIVGSLIMVIVSILVAKKDWFNNNNGKLKTSTKQMITYGLPFVFSMSVIWIFQTIDKITIKSFNTLEEVGLYSGAMSIVAIINTIQGMFTTFWTPVAYERYETNPEDTEFFSKISEIVSVAMLLIAIVVIALKDIIILFLDEKYEGAQFIFPFLVLMPIMYTISETTVLGINFKKKTKYHIYIAIASATTNLIGNLILVPIWGAKGAAISTGISYVIFFLARTYYSNKLYKIKFYMTRFLVCTLSVYILAAYSSVYKFNYFILFLSVFSIVLIVIMYRKIVIEIISNIVKKKK